MDLLFPRSSAPRGASTAARRWVAITACLHGLLLAAIAQAEQPSPPQSSTAQLGRLLTETTFQTGAIGSVLVGLTPGFAPSAGWSLEARWPRVVFALETRVSMPTRVIARSGKAVDFTSAAGLFSLCRPPSPLFGCAIAAFGEMRWGGEHVVTETQAITSGGVRAGVELKLPAHLRFRAQLDLLMNSATFSPRLDGETLWTTKAASAALGAGLIVSF